MATRTFLVGRGKESASSPTQTIVEEAFSSQPPSSILGDAFSSELPSSCVVEASSSQPPSSSVEEASSSQLPPSSVSQPPSSSVEEASLPPHVVDISSSVESNRKIILHKVPPHVRENKKHIYDPMVLSIGPYHHGRSQFQQTEQLKEEILNLILSSNVKDLFRRKILERIDDIRYFYGGISTDEFDDEALAQMMLHDTCFILYYIKIGTKTDKIYKEEHLVHRLGLSVVLFMLRDLLMLENHIPFWIIKLLIDLTVDNGDKLLCTFLSESNFGDNGLTEVPWKEGEEPLHLIEAHRITLVKEEIDASSTDQEEKTWSRSIALKIQSSPRRSVTDLKAKGIHFRPSSNCLKDIRFNSYFFYGELCLPILFVTSNSKVFLSNTIAFEMSSESETDFDVASYITFMKTLIENPDDVKELQEKGILYSCLANDEEVVKMFKEIDSLDDYGSFDLLHVQSRINEHCSSKGNTWMTELIHTYFRSPWTAIALLAATFILLCLTFLQTYYTMRPPR